VKPPFESIYAGDVEYVPSSERDRVLAHFYRRDPAEVARMCDQELDRSGELLARVRRLAAQEEKAKTVEDDYEAYRRGRRRSRDLTEHGEFARCPDCRRATVGLTLPYGINHVPGCPAPLALPVALPEEERL
jgi:hypothetical protein